MSRGLQVLAISIYLTVISIVIHSACSVELLGYMHRFRDQGMSCYMYMRRWLLIAPGDISCMVPVVAILMNWILTSIEHALVSWRYMDVWLPMKTELPGNMTSVWPVDVPLKSNRKSMLKRPVLTSFFPSKVHDSEYMSLHRKYVC
jgi:hypothetical protein